jgi:hypothetical protein
LRIPPDPEELSKLARNAAARGLPTLSLASIVALRLELDRLELAVLEEARERGATWGQLSIATGRSKGAIEARYRALRRRV